ncbi:Wzz/FepE/Etk N-terminal domain-containing protein [Thiomicrorhabdus sediminis]|uniref:LPS O-antigen chain length determinant protein, WzzB/FepE family n=1 Tax=Thiomicrorhabdus sediminis TaxID=2580412 RepID=A0A4P9K4C0_9GAMM|nr:Wzz/FepE/Etk N-terminal domain-containing protein [Thiomicrorhabdus sediminis]QCU89551.1 hypothetical protein FE785_02315 [Thiomicrorhabdus sediminis]
MADNQQLRASPSNNKIELTAEELRKILDKSTSNYVDDEIDLAELWSAIWSRKWLVLLITFITTVSAIFISVQMTPKYEASVKLMPVSSDGGASGLMAKYGGLASLAGISLPSGGDVPVAAEAVEVLKSKRFIAEFIAEKNLKPVLFNQNWDADKQQWIDKPSIVSSIKASIFGDIDKQTGVYSYQGKEKLLPGEPSIYEAVDLFLTNILTVSEDSKSGVYSLTVKWSNPVEARDWANELVQRVDEELRQKALQEAQANIDFMNSKLTDIQLQDIRNIALKSIEENLKKITFAQVQKNYVFKVIDPAIVAEQPVSPKKTLMVAVAMVLGLMLGVFLALILNWRAGSKA